MYATQQDLQDLYGEEFLIIAARDDDPELIDTDRVARVSEKSAAIIDVFVGKRHALPLLEPFDPVLVGIEGDITMYFLPNNGLERSDFSKDRKDEAMKLLDRIEKGTLELSITLAPDAETESASDGASITSNERLYTRETMGDIL